MITTHLQTLFRRDLIKLKQELVQYSKEENIWLTDKNIPNSAGNICLHLIGNLNTYIGGELGQSGYIRNRPEEFSLKNIPREDILNSISATIVMIENVMGTLTEEQLKSEYPQVVLDSAVTTDYFMIHLAMHLSYHLGQVNYHRRLLDHFPSD